MRVTAIFVCHCSRQEQLFEHSPATGPAIGDTAGAVDGTAVATGGSTGAVAGASCVKQQ